MNLEDVELLKAHGWEVECELPFEVRHVDGSFATGQAAKLVLDDLKESLKTGNWSFEEMR